MKLYTGVGPNPAVVTLFLAEKGVVLETVRIDLLKGENREAAYVARNPAGQLPCLELADGTVLAEILAICEYLDETYPDPPLIGVTPEERAVTRMWTRRIDLHIVEPMSNGFRYGEGLALFRDRVRCIPQASDDLKTLAQERLAWLDGLIAGRAWIAGERFTLADIHLFCFLRFGATVGQPLNRDNAAIAAWYDRMQARVAARSKA